MANKRVPAILIAHDPEDVGELVKTVMVYESGKVSQVVPRAESAGAWVPYALVG